MNIYIMMYAHIEKQAYMHVSIYVSIQLRIFLYAYTYRSIHKYVSVHVYIHVRMLLCVYRHRYACFHTCMDTLTNGSIHMCIHTHLYTLRLRNYNTLGHLKRACHFWHFIYFNLNILLSVSIVLY